ncbi:hypothetical protein NUSPORA_00254 [Nucleospora cyclopteri]
MNPRLADIKTYFFTFIETKHLKILLCFVIRNQTDFLINSIYNKNIFIPFLIEQSFTIGIKFGGFIESNNNRKNIMNKLIILAK